MIKSYNQTSPIFQKDLSAKLSVDCPMSVAEKATDGTTDTDGYFFDIFRTMLNSYVTPRRNLISHIVSLFVSGNN